MRARFPIQYRTAGYWTSCSVRVFAGLVRAFADSNHIPGIIPEPDFPLPARPGHQVDDPGPREGIEVLVVGCLPDREILLCRLKDRPRGHIGPIMRSPGDPAGERPLARREPPGTVLERRRGDRPGCGRHIVGVNPPAAVFLRPEDGCPDEGDPDPDILLAGGDAGDAVEEDLRDHPGIETLPNAVGQDLPDLGLRVGQKVDLGRVEDRPDARIGLGREVQAEVARDREDPGLPDVPLLVEPEELVEEGVVGAGREEFVGVVEADDERGVAVLEPGGDTLFDIVEVPAGQRRRVAADLFEDAPVDGERGVVLPAVDVDRDDPLGLFGDLAEDPADGGGLPGPRRAAEDGGESAPAPEGRADKEGEFPDLGVAVVELVGDERELEDVRISEEGLVAAEKR